MNCLYQGTPRIFGAIEVFSVAAIARYNKTPWVCKNLHWQGWGEDGYMEHCMAALGADRHEDFSMVGDSMCQKYIPCTDTHVAAYHPFKDVNKYWACWHK